jgi:hypothetical protein
MHSGDLGDYVTGVSVIHLIDLRRSREVTHLCSDRVTHAKNRPCPRARDETGGFIRAEGAQGLCIPPTSRSPGSPGHPGHAPALRQMAVLVGHFS